MIKILITGGAGNIGGSLARRLVTNPAYFVIIVDNLATGSMAKLPSSEFTNWKFIKCDVNEWNDIAPVVISYRFDFIFHYAALVGVKRTLDNPIQVLADIDGIKNILSLAKSTGVRRVFYSSSSEVYGEPVETPQNEQTTPLNSRLPYAIVKNVGEAYFNSFHKEYGLEYTIFRFFNTYGPLQSEDFVISKFMNLAFTNKDITIYGDGSQTRTFCYIDDNLDVTIRAMEDDLLVNDVVNVGSSSELSILSLAEKIVNVTQSNSKIKHLPALKEGDMARRNPDISKMEILLNRELITLEEGLKKMMSFWKPNEAFLI